MVQTESALKRSIEHALLNIDEIIAETGLAGNPNASNLFKIFVLIGVYQVTRKVISYSKQLKKYYLQAKPELTKSLIDRYGGTPRASVMVLNSVDQLGNAYCDQLAAQGFDLILSGPPIDKDRMERQAQILKERYEVRIQVVVIDYHTLGHISESSNHEIEKDLAGLDVCILVNNQSYSVPFEFAHINLHQGQIQACMAQINKHIKCSLLIQQQIVPRMIARRTSDQPQIRSAVLTVRTLANAIFEERLCYSFGCPILRGAMAFNAALTQALHKHYSDQIDIMEVLTPLVSFESPMSQGLVLEIVMQERLLAAHVRSVLNHLQQQHKNTEGSLEEALLNNFRMLRFRYSIPNGSNAAGQLFSRHLEMSHENLTNMQAHQGGYSRSLFGQQQMMMVDPSSTEVRDIGVQTGVDGVDVVKNDVEQKDQGEEWVDLGGTEDMVFEEEEEYKCEPVEGDSLEFQNLRKKHKAEMSMNLKSVAKSTTQSQETLLNQKLFGRQKTLNQKNTAESKDLDSIDQSGLKSNVQDSKAIEATSKLANETQAKPEAKKQPGSKSKAQDPKALAATSKPDNEAQVKLQSIEQPGSKSKALDPKALTATSKPAKEPQAKLQSIEQTGPNSKPQDPKAIVATLKQVNAAQAKPEAIEQPGLKSKTQDLNAIAATSKPANLTQAMPVAIEQPGSNSKANNKLDSIKNSKAQDPKAIAATSKPANEAQTKLQSIEQPGSKSKAQDPKTIAATSKPTSEAQDMPEAREQPGLKSKTQDLNAIAAISKLANDPQAKLQSIEQTGSKSKALDPKAIAATSKPANMTQAMPEAREQPGSKSKAQDPNTIAATSKPANQAQAKLQSKEQPGSKSKSDDPKAIAAISKPSSEAQAMTEEKKQPGSKSKAQDPKALAATSNSASEAQANPKAKEATGQTVQDQTKEIPVPQNQITNSIEQLTASVELQNSSVPKKLTQNNDIRNLSSQTPKELLTSTQSTETEATQSPSVLQPFQKVSTVTTTVDGKAITKASPNMANKSVEDSQSVPVVVNGTKKQELDKLQDKKETHQGQPVSAAEKGQDIEASKALKVKQFSFGPKSKDESKSTPATSISEAPMKAQKKANLNGSAQKVSGGDQVVESKPQKVKVEENKTANGPQGDAVGSQVVDPTKSPSFVPKPINGTKPTLPQSVSELQKEKQTDIEQQVSSASDRTDEKVQIEIEPAKADQNKTKAESQKQNDKQQARAPVTVDQEKQKKSAEKTLDQIKSNLSLDIPNAQNKSTPEKAQKGSRNGSRSSKKQDSPSKQVQRARFPSTSPEPTEETKSSFRSAQEAEKIDQTDVGHDGKNVHKVDANGKDKVAERLKSTNQKDNVEQNKAQDEALNLVNIKQSTTVGKIDQGLQNKKNGKQVEPTLSSTQANNNIKNPKAAFETSKPKNQTLSAEIKAGDAKDSQIKPPSPVLKPINGSKSAPPKSMSDVAVKVQKKTNINESVQKVTDDDEVEAKIESETQIVKVEENKTANGPQGGAVGSQVVDPTKSPSFVPKSINGTPQSASETQKKKQTDVEVSVSGKEEVKNSIEPAKADQNKTEITSQKQNEKQQANAPVTGDTEKQITTMEKNVNEVNSNISANIDNAKNKETQQIKSNAEKAQKSDKKIPRAPSGRSTPSPQLSRARQPSPPPAEPEEETNNSVKKILSQKSTEMAPNSSSVEQNPKNPPNKSLEFMQAQSKTPAVLNEEDSAVRDQPNKKDSAARDQPNKEDVAACDQPNKEDDVVRDRSNVKDVAARDRPNVEDATARNQPNKEDSAAHDQPNKEDVAARGRPNKEDAAACDRPNKKDPAACDRPNLEDAAAPDRSNKEDAAARDRSNVKDTAARDQTKKEDAATHDQTNKKDAARDRSNVKDDAARDRPNVKDVVTRNPPNVEDVTAHDRTNKEDDAARDQPSKENKFSETKIATSQKSPRNASNSNPKAPSEDVTESDHQKQQQHKPNVSISSTSTKTHTPISTDKSPTTQGQQVLKDKSPATQEQKTDKADQNAQQSATEAEHKDPLSNPKRVKYKMPTMETQKIGMLQQTPEMDPLSQTERNQTLFSPSSVRTGTFKDQELGSKNSKIEAQSEMTFKPNSCEEPSSGGDILSEYQELNTPEERKSPRHTRFASFDHFNNQQKQQQQDLEDSGTQVAKKQDKSSELGAPDQTSAETNDTQMISRAELSPQKLRNSSILKSQPQTPLEHSLSHVSKNEPTLVNESQGDSDMVDSVDEDSGSAEEVDIQSKKVEIVDSTNASKQPEGQITKLEKRPSKIQTQNLPQETNLFQTEISPIKNKNDRKEERSGKQTPAFREQFIQLHATIQKDDDPQPILNEIEPQDSDDEDNRMSSLGISNISDEISLQPTRSPLFTTSSNEIVKTVETEPNQLSSSRKLNTEDSFKIVDKVQPSFNEVMKPSESLTPPSSDDDEIEERKHINHKKRPASFDQKPDSSRPTCNSKVSTPDFETIPQEKLDEHLSDERFSNISARNLNEDKLIPGTVQDDSMTTEIRDLRLLLGGLSGRSVGQNLNKSQRFESHPAIIPDNKQIEVTELEADPEDEMQEKVMLQTKSDQRASLQLLRKTTKRMNRGDEMDIAIAKVLTNLANHILAAEQNSDEGGDELGSENQRLVTELATCLPFVKIAEGRYFLGTEVRAMQIKGKGVLVRTGGGYMYLYEFLLHYAKSECLRLGLNMLKQKMTYMQVTVHALRKVQNYNTDASIKEFKKRCPPGIDTQFNTLVSEVRHIESQLAEQRQKNKRFAKHKSTLVTSNSHTMANKPSDHAYFTQLDKAKTNNQHPKNAALSQSVALESDRMRKQASTPTKLQKKRKRTETVESDCDQKKHSGGKQSDALNISMRSDQERMNAMHQSLFTPVRNSTEESSDSPNVRHRSAKKKKSTNIGSIKNSNEAFLNKTLN